MIFFEVVSRRDVDPVLDVVKPYKHKGNRTRKITNDEKLKILELATNHSVAQIAGIVNRNHESVRRYLKKVGVEPVNDWDWYFRANHACKTMMSKAWRCAVRRAIIREANEFT